MNLIRLNSKINKRSNVLYIILLFVQFIISRVLIFILRASVDIRDLSGLGQHLDVFKLLNYNLSEILLNLNSQPPLWNIILSILLRISGGKLHSFTNLYLLFSFFISFLICLLVYTISLSITRNKLLALLASSIYISLSSSYFYELLIFYPLLTAFLLTLMIGSILFMHKEENEAFVILWATLSIISSFLLGLTWSLFHPLIIVIFSIYVLSLLFRKLRLIFPATLSVKSLFLVLSLLLLVLNLAWPIKNYILFNEFSSSTWLGMNLAQVSPNNLYDECNMYAKPSLAEIDQSKELTKFTRESKSNLLTDLYKRDIKGSKISLSKLPNFNHTAYIVRSKKCRKLALSSIRAKPHLFLFHRSVRFLFSHTLLSDNFWYAPVNLDVDSDSLLKQIINLRNSIYLPIFQFKGRQHHIAPLVFPIFYFLVPMIYFYKKDVLFVDRYTKLFFILCICFFLWIELAGHIFNGGEQERMRFTLEPLFIVYFTNFMFLSLNKFRVPIGKSANF